MTPDYLAAKLSKSPAFLVDLLDLLGSMEDDIPVPSMLEELDGIHAANLIMFRGWLNEVIEAVFALNTKEKDPA